MILSIFNEFNNATAFLYYSFRHLPLNYRNYKPRAYFKTLRLLSKYTLGSVTILAIKRIQSTESGPISILSYPYLKVLGNKNESYIIALRFYLNFKCNIILLKVECLAKKIVNKQRYS